MPCVYVCMCMYYGGTEFKEATGHSRFPLIYIPLKTIGVLYPTVQPLKKLCDLGIEGGSRD